MIGLFDTKLKKIRTELMAEGFYPKDAKASEYILEWSKSSCLVSLYNRAAFINKPDEEYNKTNIYSPRQIVIKFYWTEEEECNPDLLIHNIKKFCTQNMI